MTLAARLTSEANSATSPPTPLYKATPSRLAYSKHPPTASPSGVVNPAISGRAAPRIWRL